jgi:hypothetical protein
MSNIDNALQRDTKKRRKIEIEKEDKKKRKYLTPEVTRQSELHNKTKKCTLKESHAA